MNCDANAILYVLELFFMENNIMKNEIEKKRKLGMNPKMSIAICYCLKFEKLEQVGICPAIPLNSILSHIVHFIPYRTSVLYQINLKHFSFCMFA